MADDDVFSWRFLTERTRDDGVVRDDEAAQFRRRSTVRLLTAAISVVGAGREFLDVAEDVLTQQRDRVAQATEQSRGHESRSRATERDRKKIDLTY